MPVGTRIRSNNAFGAVSDNPLTGVATSFNSAALTTLPAIGVGQHTIVVFDPKRLVGQPEIVVVTDHVALSTTATITRAAYGTIARSHPVNTAWAHVAVDEDFTEILNSTTRPTDPFEGQEIYETDTKSHRHYTGALWQSAPPIGSLIPFLGVTAPTGYLFANGAEVSRTGVTADLFSVISTTYGVGNGATTFNLPNLNGRVPVGRDSLQSEFNLLGEIGGAKTVALTVNQLAQHNHGITDAGHGHTQTEHTHSIPAHNHTVNDPPHGHTISDPGHVHPVDGSTGNIIRVNHVPSAIRANDGGVGQEITFSQINNAVTNIGINTQSANVSINNNTAALGTNGSPANIIAAVTGVTVGLTGVGEAHNNLQPYITVNFIVKI